MSRPKARPELFVELPEKSAGNGIRFDRSGTMFVADYIGHNVLRIDPKTRAITVFAHNDDNEPAQRSGDRARRHALRQRPELEEWHRPALAHRPRRQDASRSRDMGTTNGIEVSPDGKTLYVNESVQRNVWAFDITADGSLEKSAC